MITSFPHFFRLSKNLTLQDFPGGPEVGTLCFQRRGCEFNPWSGTKIPHAAWHGILTCEPTFALRMSGRVIVQSLPRERPSNQPIISSVQRMVGLFLHFFFHEIISIQTQQQMWQGPFFLSSHLPLSSFLPYPSILSIQSVIKCGNWKFQSLVQSQEGTCETHETFILIHKAFQGLQGEGPTKETHKTHF